MYCKSAFYCIRRIAKIRDCLPEESAAALVHAFVSCRLDMLYAFVLFAKIPIAKAAICLKLCRMFC